MLNIVSLAVIWPTPTVPSSSELVERALLFVIPLLVVAITAVVFLINAAWTGGYHAGFKAATTAQSQADNGTSEKGK